MGTPRKLVLLGWDAPIASRVYEYALAGHLPAVRNLMDHGVWARNCLVPYPTITPPNWTTIVTGAWPGTHGITDYSVHYPGDPLDRTHQGFDTADCQAEYLWTAAERAGKKTILVNYPSTWPPTLRYGSQLGGDGLSLGERRLGIPLGNVMQGLSYKCNLADEQLFATDDYPFGNRVDLEGVSTWRIDPSHGPALQARLELAYRRAMSPLEPSTWHALVCGSQGSEYDRLLLSTEASGEPVFASLAPGQWSPIVTQIFDSSEGARKAAFRCKLMELDPDTGDFRLYVTALCARDVSAWPDRLGSEIESTEGLPLPRSGAFIAFILGWVDADTLLDTVEFEAQWLGDGCISLMRTQDWDLLFMHAHAPDFAYHTFSRKLEPLVGARDEEIHLYEKLELGIYQRLDRMLGGVVAEAGDETLFIVVSDHGAKASATDFRTTDVLARAGLLCYVDVAGGRQVIDWARTRAFPQRSCYVYVNLKGRDPDGIVEPGIEYERVRQRVIDALLEYREPETGLRPIVLALRKEDARVLGLYGDRMGDVVYAIRPEFGHEHGPFLPTATYGMGGMRGVFLMAGPGVKKGYLMERTMSLTDIVPTICHLMDLPVPAHAEGGILYQALQDPDGKRKDVERLRRNYERLKNAVESEQALTHTYFMK